MKSQTPNEKPGAEFIPSRVFGRIFPMKGALWAAWLAVFLLGTPSSYAQNYPITFQANFTFVPATSWVTKNAVSNAVNDALAYDQSIFAGSYSGETISINLNWTPMGKYLGGCYSPPWVAGSVITNPKSSVNSNAVYTIAEANQVAGRAIPSIGSSMKVDLNSANINWDYSTTTKAAGTESLYATMIHEITHGLGFWSRVDSTTGAYDDFYIGNTSYGPWAALYDTFLAQNIGPGNYSKLTNMSPASRLSAITSGQIYFNGSNATNYAGGPIQIYAPNPYESGSSMSHPDSSIDTNRSLLMNYAPTQNIPENLMYSPLEIGILQDLGYSFNIGSYDNGYVTNIQSGSYADAFFYLGSNSSSSFNGLTLSGAGTRLTNASGIYIGYGGSGNNLNISNGGQVFNYDAYIGFAAASSNNSALVTGAGSLWTSVDQLTIGNQGSGNMLTISNGGQVSSYLGVIGNIAASSNNSALVTGAGSLWTNGLQLMIGNSGSGSLTVVNGGRISSGGIRIAWQTGSAGTLNIGALGGSDTAGMISSPWVQFGRGSGAINFNQTDRITLGSAIYSYNSSLGAGAINQFGSGITILTGNNTNFFGVTTITNGTLQLGNGISTARADSAGNFILSNNASLVFFPAQSGQYVINGNISGSGSLSMVGSGITYLDGANSYTGTTTISAGDLVARSTNAFGASTVSVGGISAAMLSYNTNVTVVSLFLGANSQLFPYLTSGSTGTPSLTVTGLLSGLGTVSIDLKEYYRVGTNTILSFGSSSAFTNTSNFTTTKNDPNKVLSLIGNNLQVACTQQTNFIIGNAQTPVPGDPSLYIGSNSTSTTVDLFINPSPTESYAFDNTYVGCDSNATANILTVANSGTMLTNSVDLFVGFSGSSNAMEVANEAVVVNNNGFIGYNTSSSGNSVLITDTGSLWSNAADLYIGYDGSSNSLMISNGASVAVNGSNAGSVIGYGTNSSNNSVVVTGNGSSWSNNFDLTVGFNGSGNSLSISNGGAVFADLISGSNGVVVGYGANASNNSVLVSGSGSSLSSASALIVGYDGSSNSLTISFGGQVANSNNASIGYTTNSSNNSVLVSGVSIDGTASLWTNSADLIVGNNGSGNSLMISNGASVAVNGSNAGSVIGYGTNSSNNSVVVTGNGSSWSNNFDLTVGFNGSGNSLSISNGGAVFADLISGSNGVVVGYGTNSSNNSVFVSGSGSLLMAHYDLTVGYNGSGNTILIADGGMATNNSSGNDYGGVIGFGANSSNNSVQVTGTNIDGTASTWYNNYDFMVGYNGSRNSLTISNGGDVSANINSGSNGVVVGYGMNSSNNSVLVTGRDSGLNDYYDLTVGYYGSSNSLAIFGGEVYADISSNSNGVVVGYGTNSSNNSVLVSGSNSSLIACYDLTAGYNGSGNSLVISNGGLVAADIATNNNAVTNGGEIYSGNSSGNDETITSNNNGVVVGYGMNASNNSVVVTGSGSSLYACYDLTVGYNGSGNNLVISNGGLVAADIATNNTGVVVGYGTNASNNSVVVTGSSSSLTAANNLTVGYNGSVNSLVISNGGVIAASNTIIGEANTASNNSALVTGAGSMLTNSSSLKVGDAGSGTLTVANGGLLTSASMTIAAGTGSSGTLNIGTLGGSDTAGTISSPTIAFGSGSGMINFSQSDTATLTSSISGNGSVNQLGLGTSILSGSNSYGGTTAISTGTLQVASTNALGASAVTLGGAASTGTLSLATNLTIASLNWASNGVVALTPGSQILSISAQMSNSGGGLFNFGNTPLSNATNLIISFGGQSGFTSNSFGVIGVQGYSFLLTSNSLSTTIAATANLIISTNITIANSLQVGSFSVDGGTATISPSGSLNATNGITVNSGFLGDSGTITTPSLTVNGGAVTISSGGTMNASNAVTVTGGSLTDNGTLNTTNLIENSGSISVGSGGVLNVSDTVSVNGGILTDNGILNTPNLTIGPGGMLTGSGTINDALNNAGLIVMNGMTINEIDGGVNNSGTITGSGVINGSVTNSGQIVMNSLIINAPNGGVNNSGTISGNGVINGNLMSSGTLLPGSVTTTGTLTINGNLSQSGTSSTLIPVGAGGVSQLAVSGSATLGGSLTLLPLPGASLSFGQQLPFLSAASISGSFNAINAPAGFRGRLLLTSTLANILIAPQSYTHVALNQNQTNVARALNSFILATTGDQAVVSTALDSLTLGQYQQAFNAIMPTLYQSMSTIAFNLANAQNSELIQRLWGLRVAGTGFSMSGFADNTPVIEGQADKGVLDSQKDILRPRADNHWGMFVDGNGIFAQASSGNMLPTYNSQSGGVTTGFTYKWNECFGTGLYAGYEGSYAKYSGGSSLIDNSVRFGLFGTYGHPDGKGFYADALAGGGYNNYQIRRNITFPGMSRTANSSPGAGELDTMLAGGYDLKKGNWTYGPTMSLQYTYFGANPVNETGAQSLNFSSGGWNTSSLLGSLGAHATYSWQANKDIVVVPQVSLSWQHEFMQNPYSINGSMGNSPIFANTSSAPLRDTLYTGVGVTVEFYKKWNTSFFYNASAGNANLTSQNIFWSAGVKF